MPKRKIFLIIVFCTVLSLVAFDLSSAAKPVKKISLDIKGLDILDVFKIIAEQGGFNIVAGRNITGKVTIFLKDVDIWDAFEIIFNF